VRTPHLDALAAGGVRAASGYVTAPQCVPSRGGLLTGRVQGRFNLDSNGSALDGFNQQTTIAARLQKAGYATGMSGKWHLGPLEEITRHGFADVFCNQGPGGRAWANFDLEGNTIPGALVPSPLYHLEANAAAKPAFLARSRFQAVGPVTAKLSLKTSTAGQAAIAWRTSEQNTPDLRCGSRTEFRLPNVRRKKFIVTGREDPCWVLLRPAARSRFPRSIQTVS
jgi:arylsulfatase A-like enzyme